jgi:Xaa-Pro aminopeptidase/Xaa-Pro dipeptidase
MAFNVRTTKQSKTMRRNTMVATENIKEPPYSWFSRVEFENRTAKAKELMKKYDIDALVLTSTEDLMYFTGLLTLQGALKDNPRIAIIPQETDDIYHIMPDTTLPVAKQCSWVEKNIPWLDIRPDGSPGSPILSVKDILEDHGLQNKVIGMELGFSVRLEMPIELYHKLQEIIPDAKIVDATPLIWDLRMRKSEAEIEALRKACKISCDAFEYGFSQMKPGMKESELESIIFREMCKEPHSQPAFLGIRSGPAKYPMFNVLAFDKPLESGDLVVVDGGAKYKSYICDFMRLLSMGKPSDEYQRFFDAHIASQRAGVAALRAGVSVKEVFRTAMKPLEDAGVRKWAPFNYIGHGVGLDAHEPPHITGGGNFVLEEGMVLTMEPVLGDIKKGSIGMYATEDVVVIREGGCEMLTPIDKELRIIE